MGKGYGWQTVSLSTSVDQPWFTHLLLAIPSTQEVLQMKANEVLADLSSAEVAADEKLVSRNSKEQLDRIAMVWQEWKESSMPRASIPEKTIQKEVKRLSCFAYNLRKEDPAKEDLRNKKHLVQKRWQWWCTFCWASCHHLLRSWGPMEAVPQLWSCMTPCVLAQGVHHVCDQISWKEKSHYHRQGNSYENIFTFRKAEEADKWVWRVRRNSQAHFRTRWSLSLLESFLLPLFCDRKQGLQLVYVFIKLNDF